MFYVSIQTKVPPDKSSPKIFAGAGKKFPFILPPLTKVPSYNCYPSEGSPGLFNYNVYSFLNKYKIHTDT